VSTYDDRIGREERRERECLKARNAWDEAANLLLQARRTAARAAEELRRLPGGGQHATELVKLQNHLIKVECGVLEKSEIRGEQAARKIPKTPREPLEGPEWCSCSMYLEPHIHRNRRPVPEEVPP